MMVMYIFGERVNGQAQRVRAPEKLRGKHMFWNLVPKTGEPVLVLPFGTNKLLLHTNLFRFWGIIFGNYYRKLYSIKFLGN